MRYHWGQTAAKKGTWSFKQRTSNNNNKKKKPSKFVSTWNNNRVVYIASPKYSESKRFARSLNKVERKYIQEKQPN